MATVRYTFHAEGADAVANAFRRIAALAALAARACATAAEPTVPATINPTTPRGDL